MRAVWQCDKCSRRYKLHCVRGVLGPDPDVTERLPSRACACGGQILPASMGAVMTEADILEEPSL